MSEGSLGHHRVQILIGRGNHPHVHRSGLGAADPLNLAFLQYSQQLGLHRHRHITDLIEKNRSAVCHFKLAGLAAFAGAGKGAVLITEQLGFEQVFRYGSANDLDERAMTPVTRIMDRLGEQLLAGAAFTGHQHG